MNQAEQPLRSLNDSGETFRKKALSYPRHAVRLKPTDIAFSATEIVFHMLDVEQLWQDRITKLVSGKSKNFTAIDPDELARRGKYNDKDFELGLKLWSQDRKRTVRMIEDLSDAQLDLEGIHSKYGPMSILQILDRMSMHDVGHTAQLDRTLNQISGQR